VETVTKTKTADLRNTGESPPPPISGSAEIYATQCNLSAAYNQRQKLLIPNIEIKDKPEKLLLTSTVAESLVAET
jgi:hypothetical protein